MEKPHRKGAYLVIGCVLLGYFSLACNADGRDIDLRRCVVSQAESYLHVREATGRNDGPKVAAFLHYVGLNEGLAWCTAFTCTVLGKCGIDNPRTGWTPGLFTGKYIVWKASDWRKGFHPQPAMVAGWTFGKNRYSHSGIIVSQDKSGYNTIEGNTNQAGSREGDGVYRKLRKTVDVIADYIEPHLRQQKADWRN